MSSNNNLPSPPPEKPKVLLLGQLFHAQETWSSLSCIADLISLPDSTTRTDFLHLASTGALNGVVAAYRTVESISQTGPWDAELARSLPPSFRFICHNGAGYDQLRPADLLGARGQDKGGAVYATHTPVAVDDATADTALFLLLAVLRNYAPLVRSVRDGQWRGAPPATLGSDPAGKTLGILGLGGIGGQLARRAKALGMRVVYHNRSRVAAESELGLSYVGFDELLGESDVISVHVPLTASTRHLLSDAQFGKMKRGVHIVNTSRGAVIDEAALIRALENGIVGRAGLDVFENEPEIPRELRESDRTFLLPHVGTYTRDTQKKMEEFAIANVKAAVLGEWEKMSFIAEHKEAVKSLR